MRIGRSAGPAPARGSPQRAPPQAGFAPTATAAASAAPARAGALGPLAGLDTLLALQALGGPLDRRRRQVARAGRMLDGLDAVRLSLLDGESPTGALQALARSASQAREGVDEPGLSEVLDAIETRAAVELAKRERPAAT